MRIKVSHKIFSKQTQGDATLPSTTSISLCPQNCKTTRQILRKPQRLVQILWLNWRDPLQKKRWKMMKLVSMDVLYFSAYGDFPLNVNIGHTVVQKQHFTCVD